MKSKSGFTLIEVAVTIAVIAILIAIIGLSLQSVQRDSRDSERYGNAIVVKQALEKYYAENGEYPSERSLVNAFSENTGSHVATILDVQADALLMPHMPDGTTNPLTSEITPQNDYISYIANSAADNEDCQNAVTGGCDEFTLKYIEESGDVITIESKHKGRAVTSVDQPVAVSAPSTPSMSVTLSSGDIIATVAPVSCTTGTPEYALRSRTNDGQWTGYSDWSTTARTTSDLVEQGVKYGFQAQARCHNSGNYSNEVASNEATYAHSIATPPAPIINVSTSGDMTTWTWNATPCPAGTTARYQTHYIADWGYNSAWYGPYTFRTDYWQTDYQGYEYITEVRTHCYNNYMTSDWSAVASAAYIRPITPPGAPTDFYGTLSTDRRRYTWRWTEPTCGLGVHPEVSSNMYIMGNSSTGHTWYWANTGQSGWYGWWPVGWYTPSFYVQQVEGASEIPVGGSTQIQAKYICVNATTGRTSTWGPIGMGPMDYL